ncbi:response regulator [Cytobacillus oceanisediminis]|nr:response regulator [Cytobacillus oceanisediminis]MCM3245320.1 response regulator [Cytobacillus oceanisediminis]
MAIKIAIADDHKLFREGVKRILEMEEDLEAAAEGEDGNEALIIDKNYRPDVMIMNIRYAYYEWHLSSG